MILVRWIGFETVCGIYLSRLRRIESEHASLVVAAGGEAPSWVAVIMNSAAVAAVELVSLVAVLDEFVW